MRKTVGPEVVEKAEGGVVYPIVYFVRVAASDATSLAAGPTGDPVVATVDDYAVMLLEGFFVCFFRLGSRCPRGIYYVNVLFRDLGGSEGVG